MWMSAIGETSLLWSWWGFLIGQNEERRGRAWLEGKCPVHFPSSVALCLLLEGWLAHLGMPVDPFWPQVHLKICLLNINYMLDIVLICSVDRWRNQSLAKGQRAGCMDALMTSQVLIVWSRSPCQPSAPPHMASHVSYFCCFYWLKW